MRVTPKFVHGSLTTPQRASTESSRQSFLDTLTSASSAPVQKTEATKYEERRSSEERSEDVSNNQKQNSNSFETQSEKDGKASNKAEQSVSASQSTRQNNPNGERSTGNAPSEKCEQDASTRKSDGPSSKKAAFTAQVASTFTLQASTTQPELNGALLVVTTATGTDGSVAKSDLSAQSIDAQANIAISSQCSELPGQLGVIGSIAVAGINNLRVEQGNDSEQAAADLKTTHSGAGQLEQELARTNQVSDSKSMGNVLAQLSTEKAASESSSVPTFSPTGMSQANLAGETRRNLAVGTSDGKVNQAAVKAIQAKVSGSAFGINSNLGDSTRTEKSGDGSDDRSSLTSAEILGQQVLNAQPGSGHVAAVEAKGIDAGVQQTILAAAQVETRGAAGTPSGTHSNETAAHAGNWSEGLTPEELNGNELAGMSGISAARLIQTVGASEMRVGMHSSEFGEISIRTSVTEQQMQTQISVNHNELGNALSAHIPNTKVILGSEYGLHASIEVNQNGTSFSSDGGRSQQHEQETRVRTVEIAEGPAALQSDVINLKTSPVTTEDYRLDIRA